MPSNEQAWLHCDEIAFIQGVGTYNEGSAKVTRLVWLQRYLAVAALRVEWGKINKGLVMLEATRLLKMEQRKQG